MVSTLFGGGRNRRAEHAARVAAQEQRKAARRAELAGIRASNEQRRQLKEQRKQARIRELQEIRESRRKSDALRRAKLGRRSLIGTSELGVEEELG